jgi:hypothetical protein
MACLAAAGGCASDGLSPREVRGQDYATYAFSMSEAVDPKPAATVAAPGSRAVDSKRTSAMSEALDSNTATTLMNREPVLTPARIAVGQLGEVAPPLSMLESLRKQHDLFVSVQPVPALLDVAAPPLPNRPGEMASARQEAREHGERMRRYAAGIGADYKFLCGGTVDRATTDTAYKLANATIIGAFVMPSERIQASARASGSLIEVKSGRVVLSVSSDGRREKIAPSVSREGHEIALLEALRGAVIQELAGELTQQIRAQGPGH